MSNVRILSLGEVSLLLADVKHSQKLTATPLYPWIAAEWNGRIICVHCTCMAGLREACYHISTLLLTLGAHAQQGLQYLVCVCVCVCVCVYMISWPFFTPRKMHMCMNLDHVASGSFVLRRDVHCEFDYWPLAVSMPPTKVCPQCKAAVPVRWKTCERCDHVFRSKRKTV